VHQACDTCRIRKRKCSFGGDDPVRWSGAAQNLDWAARCYNCQKIDSPCTFRLPLKARGPKRKNAHRPDVRQSFPSEDDDLGLEVEVMNGQSPLSQFALSNPSSYTGQSSVRHADKATSPTLSRAGYPTDVLCPRDLMRLILNDYLVYVYPLVPVVHRPSFEADLRRDRDLQDEEFLILLICLCATTVGLLRSQFRKYQEYSSPLPFLTRTEMANHCYKLVQGFRDVVYFDTVSHQKWASSFLLGIAMNQTDNTNLWRMLEIEAMQLARMLEVQRVASYQGLDAIEVQLRKKAFWLMFYGYAHQSYNLRNERLSFLDPIHLREINPEDLMPASVDDEFITSDGILPCSEALAATSMTAGFIIHSRVFWAALNSPGPNSCTCNHQKNAVERLSSLKDRLHQLKYMLDSVEPAFSPWGNKPSDPEDVTNIQREAIRVNIHLTHLWAQIMLLDQIDSINNEQISLTSPTGSSSTVSPGAVPGFFSWDEREDVCRQLLYLLHSFSRSGLEANGTSVVSSF
jgi:hypothetical protein